MEFPRDQLAEFIRNQITGDLKEVPGINNAIEKTIRLNTAITNTHQLIGKYLSGKDSETNNFELFMKFKYWLQINHVKPQVAQVITIAIAEKIASIIPGLYDPSIAAE